MSEQIPEIHEEERSFREQFIDHIARIGLLGAYIDEAKVEEVYKSNNREKALTLLFQSMGSFVPPKDSLELKAAMDFFIKSGGLNGVPQEVLPDSEENTTP